MDTVRAGGCLCGHIRYRAEGEMAFPHLCSCDHCQRLSGAAAMSWVDFAVDGFKWTGEGGEPTWHKTWPTTSRGFCPECGSSVAGHDDDGERMGVTIMSLDDSSDVIPIHQSSADNAVSWQPPLESQLDL